MTYITHLVTLKYRVTSSNQTHYQSKARLPYKYIFGKPKETRINMTRGDILIVFFLYIHIYFWSNPEISRSFYFELNSAIRIRIILRMHRFIDDFK